LALRRNEMTDDPLAGLPALVDDELLKKVGRAIMREDTSDDRDGTMRAAAALEAIGIEDLLAEAERLETANQEASEELDRMRRYEQEAEELIADARARLAHQDAKYLAVVEAARQAEKWLREVDHDDEWGEKYPQVTAVADFLAPVLEALND
jgi:hypothetical protein